MVVALSLLGPWLAQPHRSQPDREVSDDRTTAALVPIQPVFTDAGRFALAVATLPGDSPARDRGSVGIRRGGARFPGYAW